VVDKNITPPLAGLNSFESDVPSGNMRSISLAKRAYRRWSKTYAIRWNNSIKPRSPIIKPFKKLIASHNKVDRLANGIDYKGAIRIIEMIKSQNKWPFIWKMMPASNNKLCKNNTKKYCKIIEKMPHPFWTRFELI
jgi:hypothetical protein